MAGTSVSRRDFLKAAGALSAAVECGDAPVKNWAGAGLIDFPNASDISDSAVLSFQKKRFACSVYTLVTASYRKN